MRAELLTRDVPDFSDSGAVARNVKTYRMTYDSVAEHLADVQAKENYRSNSFNRRDMGGTLPQVYRAAELGWAAELPASLAVAEAAVSKCEAELTMPRYERVMGTRGKRADIGRYLAGMPECMVSMRPAQIVKAGKIITLCVSNCYSASLTGPTIIRRGQGVTALALALANLGYELEIWSDFTSGAAMSVRTLVKAPHDVVDPARILFALAHPGMLRVLIITSIREAMANDKRARGKCSMGLGPVRNPIRDLPEGTIYMNSLRSSFDVPDPEAVVAKHLAELGLTA